MIVSTPSSLPHTYTFVPEYQQHNHPVSQSAHKLAINPFETYNKKELLKLYTSI